MHDPRANWNVPRQISLDIPEKIPSNILFHSKMQPFILSGSPFPYFSQISHAGLVRTGLPLAYCLSGRIIQERTWNRTLAKGTLTQAGDKPPELPA